MSWFSKSSSPKDSKKDDEEDKDADDKDVEEDDDKGEEVVVLDPLAGMKNLCGKELLADVHFLVSRGKEQERIPGHSLVLASRSEVFKAMLYQVKFSADNKTVTHVRATGSQDIVIDDVSPGAWKKLMSAVYLDEVEVDAKDVTELIQLGKRFQVDSLKVACVDYMEQEVTADKACELFDQGRKLLNEPSFGLAFIEENIEDILATDGWVDLPRDCVETILRSSKLAADEVDLFSGMEKWAVAECKRQKIKADGPTKRQILGDLLQLIRFPLMEMSELVSKVQSSNILTPDELLALFTYLAAPEGKKPKTTFSAKERDGGSSKVVVEEFSWSNKFSNMQRITINGLTCTSIAGTCNADVLAIAELKKPWTKGTHYWRVSVTGGCINRAGIVEGEFDKSKFGGDSNWGAHNMPLLGGAPKTWGVSLGSHSSYGEQQLYGGAASTTGQEIGLMLDIKNKKLHVFSNGNFHSTAFTNVVGKSFRPAILMCHQNSRGACLAKANVKPPALPKQK